VGFEWLYLATVLSVEIAFAGGCFFSFQVS
jgi:hypothetical protein